MLLRYWQTRTHCCGNIVAHDVSLRAQTGKHLLRTQNVADQNQKHFCVPAPVVRKPINANPRLNRQNPRSKFILRLNSVPRRPISTIQGLN